MYAFPKIGAYFTSREGSRRRRTLHGIAAGPKTGRAGRYAPLPTEGAATIACAVEEQCAPPAHTHQAAPAARLHNGGCSGAPTCSLRWCAATGEGATRRSTHMYACACWCMHHVLTSVPFTAGTQSQQMTGYYAIATAETAWVAALVCLVHVLCARSIAAALASTTSSRSRIARSRLCGRLCGRCRC